MDSLYQRLKELNPDAFQKLCFHILKERHPGLQVRHVEGAGGDEGLDVFAGSGVYALARGRFDAAIVPTLTSVLINNPSDRLRNFDVDGNLQTVLGWVCFKELLVRSLNPFGVFSLEHDVAALTEDFY